MPEAGIVESSRADVAGERVACIGLGVMGGAMAACMAAHGYAVHGVDPRAEAVQRLETLGGHAASTPAQAARGARLAVIVVHDASQVDAVLSGDDGLLAGLKPGAAIWLASTVGPAYVRALAQDLAQRGVALLDGPVSGGASGAREGRLTVLAGGTNAALDALLPLMRSCTAHVHHVGEAGAGSALKMTNQVLVAAHIALTAEALALGRRTGVDLSQLIRAVRDSSGNSVMFDKRAQRMAEGEHEVQATIGLFLKDLDIALQEADALGQGMPIAQAARRVFAAAAAQGLMASSDTRLFDVYMQDGGVPPATGETT